MKNRRYCLVVILPQASFSTLGEICLRYNILNPKNQNNPNVSDLIRMMVYFHIRKNKIKCLSEIDIPIRLTRAFENIDFGSINFRGMKEGIGRGKCEERRTIRVTDLFHEATIELSSFLSVDYGDIIRCCSDFLINEFDGGDL